MLRSTDLLALPAVDCDKAYAMQLSLEDTLLTTQTVYFQVALLYPSMRMIIYLQFFFTPTVSIYVPAYASCSFPFLYSPLCISFLARFLFPGPYNYVHF